LIHYDKGGGVPTREHLLLPTKVIYKEKFIDVVASKYHSIALTKSNCVVTFGSNHYSAIGNVTDSSQHALKPVIVQFFSNTPVSRIFTSSSANSNVVITQSGKVYAWGCNVQGHLRNNNAPRILPTEIKELSGKKIANISVHVSSRVIN
jgi:alpha-tubulin suppressor-like RCC1 family protein